MSRSVRIASLTLVAVALALLGAGRVAAQVVVVAQPTVTYYSPPAVTCYSPPVIAAPAPVVSYYTPAPAVSYSYGSSVSYYTPAPAMSYYAPSVSYYSAPAAVTTTRYGLFGRPRVSTTYYVP
jgi:hypothetical protein